MSADILESDDHFPCPFCGGTPKLEGASLPQYDFVDFWFTQIVCSDCGAQSHAIMREHGDNEAEKIDEVWRRWDARPPILQAGEHLDQDGLLLRGLYKIRPLQWHAVVLDDELTYVAEHLFGRYAAWEKDGVAWIITPGESIKIQAGSRIEDAFASAARNVYDRLMTAISKIEG